MKDHAPVPSQRRRVALLLAAPLVGLLLLELAIRGLLFTDAGRAMPGFDSLRQASLFAERGTPTESDYWRLLYALEPEDRSPLPRRHAELGWLNNAVDHETYVHHREAAIGERRPVLLIGSSYFCKRELERGPTDAFEAGPLVETHALLNCSVGGYGLGQIALLTERMVARYRHLDPIVVIGIHADADPRRMPLDFRHGPKPSFRVEDETLVERPPTDASLEHLLSPAGIEVRSYLLALLARGAGLRSESAATAERNRHMAGITAMLEPTLERIAQAVGGLDAGVVLVNGASIAKDPERAALLEGSVVTAIESAELPWIAAHHLWLLDLKANRGRIVDYFLPGDGHPSQRAMDLIARAVERVVERRAVGSAVLFEDAVQSEGTAMPAPTGRHEQSDARAAHAPSRELESAQAPNPAQHP